MLFVMQNVAECKAIGSKIFGSRCVKQKQQTIDNQK
jgi:hypothetical protein